MVNNCEGCLEKQRKIDQLLEEVQCLKAKLRYQERKDKEGFFRSSTPSSQLPFKANTDQENKNHKGGARPGHKGHGRKAHSEETADEIISIDPGEICPDCGGVLKLKTIKDATVIESEPVRPKRILYHLSHKECTQCHHVFRSKAPGVLPKALYGNQITAQMVVMHYFHGIPMGRICEMTGINLGSLVDLFHRLSGYFAPVMDLLKEQYRYAHLLRDVEKLAKDFPDSPEVQTFVSILAPLLSQAMHLRTQPLSDEHYYREAKEIQKKIMEVNKSPAQHLAIRAMQDLFNTNEHRLYHWVQDRRVPPDNNLADRDLRPTVIARKVSFGSSSDAGSKTRSVLMSVLHTLNKRRGDHSLESIFKNLLDEIAKNPKVQIASLFPQSKSIPHN